MSCPVSGAVVGLRSNSSAGQVGDVVDQFDRFSGSVLVALFAAGLFDQAMLPPVSAALENTGRIRNDPIGRALRSAASEQIMFAASDEDRRAEAQRLLRLHRDVRGIGPDGIRYSALSAESWNWIMISTFFMHRGGYIAVTGRQLSSAENQAIWNRFRDLSRDLHLPGRGARLIDDYDELCGYYDKIVAGKLQRTATLDCAVRATLHPNRPTNLPAVATPVWTAIAPLVGHVLAVLGFGIMHHGVRAIVPMQWTRRH